MKPHRKDRKEAADMLPPHDQEAEFMVLACAVHKPDTLVSLTEELFYDRRAKSVFAAMQQLRADKRHVTERAETFEHELMLRLDHRNFEPINAALNDLPSASNYPYWLDRVQDCANAREVGRIQVELGRAAACGQKTELAAYGKRLQELAASSTSSVGRSLHSVIPELIDELEAAFANQGKLRGLPTGFRRLNKVTLGLQQCRLYVIAGRPGQGKTAMGLQIAAHVAATGAPVAFFSLEMPAVELAGRIVQANSRVSLNVFGQGGATQDHFHRVQRGVLNVTKLPLTLFDDRSALSDIVAGATEAVRQQGAKLIVIDYLQRVTIPGFQENRTTLVTTISTTLKDLAMSLRVPVLAMAQLNRSNQKEGRKPTLADLRDSGSIEQDADFVGLLHQDENDPSSCELLVGKNRSGETGAISYAFQGAFTRFEEATPPPDTEIPA